MRTRCSLPGVRFLPSSVHRRFTTPVALALAPLVQLGSPGGSPPCRAEVIQALHAEPGSGDLGFGHAVVLDGKELLVGASAPDEDRPGAVQVFRDTPAGFEFHERILPSTSTVGDLFGTRLVVEGERLFAVGGTPFTGTVVFVFARQTSGPSTWVEVAQIPVPAYGGYDPYFSLDADGDVLVLTSPAALQIRERDQGGPDGWGITKLIPLPQIPPPSGFFAFFGPGVAVDGDTIVALVPEDNIHPYFFYALVFERDLGGPNAWGFAGLLRQDPRYLFGYWMQLQDDFLFLEEQQESAFLYLRDPGTQRFAEARSFPYCQGNCTCEFFPSALRVRDGLVARAGWGGDCVNVSALRIHRRSSGSSGAPPLALVNETLFPGVTTGFASIDVQGERLVLGAPSEGSSAGLVLVLDLACPREQVPLPLTPR